MTSDRIFDLVTVFLGILLEAGPFLLFGALAAAALEVFVPADRLAARLPRNRLIALLGGIIGGAAAPLCECGTVPIARGSIDRGLPLPAAIGFLLAAPVINPITIAATYTAFHDDLNILAWRVILGVGVALLVGLLFFAWPAAVSPLRVAAGREHDHHPTGNRRLALLEVTGHELQSLLIYLVGAASLAAALQVFLPRSQLLSAGQGPLFSVLIMLAVALVLSTCSSVDAFVALAFSTTFSSGAILAFLLISPVLNLKSGALVAGLFRAPVAAALFSSASLTIIAATLAINYHLVSL